MQNAIYPGKVWLDTNGNPIHVHAGGIFYEKGTYYWYGENKEKSVKGANIWHWGMRCYSSSDLYNWTDCGLIIPPLADDVSSPLHPSKCADRPHILYNKKTKKYVCWIKVMGEGNEQSMTILTADNFLGAYTIVKTNYKPHGMNSGDFYFAKDEKTQRVYYYFEKVHTELICTQLTDDYLSVTDSYTSHFANDGPPDVREAPVHFIRNDKHYLITSGTTGYFPNPSEVAVSNNYQGAFTVLGNPHPKDETETSFSSQISEVFKIEGTETYIAIADRWKPDMNITKEQSMRLRSAFKMMHSNPDALVAQVANHAAANANEDLSVKLAPGEKRIDNENTAIATYVWLPIRFDGDMPIIDWYDSWKIEDFIK